MQKSLLALPFFFLLTSMGQLLAQPCACTNCPQFMPDLFVGDFTINVQGASNPTLGQNGQGVCGVIVHWDHTAICDISITLTSPSGQAVTLVGPIGSFCTNQGNTGTDWNVTFLPCGSGAMPDPGFTAQWNNNQNWGANNSYSGSYYPFSGCLQNFTGPVNGNWTLTVTDGQAQDTGNLYNFEIIFCDPSGINCVSCAPDAGALTQADVSACEGAPELSLDLPPTYNPPATNDPGPDYSYTYVISGTGGVIQAFSATPDLSGFSAGNFTVCGLSYLTAHQNLLPAPNGSLTITQLTNQLASNTPPFCGAVSTNCVGVTIFPIPPDEETTAEICAPACYDFLGDFYCQSGTYTIDQVDNNGCHYNAILYLKVNNPSFKTISEFVCPGECSTHPLFSGACSPGQYQATLTNYLGCDSILTLNLTVLNVDAVIQPPGMLSCIQTTVALSGVGSTIGGGTTYLWTASNGGQISGPNNLINATAAAAGTYKLLVCRTISGVTCCDSAMVQVTANAVLPGAPVVTGVDTVCVGDTLIYSVFPQAQVSNYQWTVPAGVTLLSGQGTNSVTVVWVSATGGNICAAGVNACGQGPFGCLSVQTTTIPSAPVVHGNISVCKDSLENYMVDTIPGIQQFNWVVTGGAVVSNNGNQQVTIRWNGNTSTGTVCVTAQNDCGQSQPACLNIDIKTVPTATAISGDTLLCAGANGQYSIASIPNATGYQWTITGNGTLVSGQNSPSIVVKWNSAPGGSVCVAGVNTCGVGPQQCLNVQVLEQPIAQAGPDGSVCGISYTLQATPSVAGSSGLWSALAGPGTASFNNSASPAAVVTVSAGGLYQFVWRENNGACVDEDTVQVNFLSVPAGGPIQHTCDPTNTNYTVQFSIIGGTGPFTVPGGTVSGTTFVSDPIPNAQSYLFVITDANGCVSAPIGGVFNCNCATNAGQMVLQPLSACPGDSITVQASTGANLDGDDVAAFVLHTNSGSILGTILDENTTGVFHFLTGMTHGVTYYVSYVVGNNLNGLPDMADPCLSIAPGQPVVFYDNPVANAGADQLTCGLTIQISGNPAGVWSLLQSAPGGTAGIAFPNNPSTSVTATQYGAYTLSYTVTVNGCVDTDTLGLVFASSPTAGPVSYTCDPTNQFYTVSFIISGGQSPYSVNGQNIAGGNFVSNQIASTTSYQFTITDANGCVSAPVTGSYSCGCSTTAAQLDLTPQQLCQSDSIFIAMTVPPIQDGDDTTAYVLHTGPANTIGTVLLQNSTGRFGYWATLDFGVTYYISSVAGNNLNGFPDPADPCFSFSAGIPVVFTQNPTPNAGSDFIVCGLNANMAGTQGLFSGVWSQVSGPGTTQFSDDQSAGSGIIVSQAGDYVFRWDETNGNCSGFDEVNVTFWDNPTLDTILPTCNNTNTGYTIQFNVTTAGQNSFSIVGLNGAGAGGFFQSVELPNDGSYSFHIQDALGCISQVYSGTHHCDCTTSAGTMNLTPLLFCADQPAVAAWNNDGVLDGNDGVQFILHDQAGATLGNILGTNNQPTFNFGAGLQTGTTYYISAIAGNLISGTVDKADMCLSIAPGTPVQWKAKPIAALSGDATICNGSSTVLNINGSGAFPLQLLYDDGAGTPTLLTLQNQQTIPISVSPTATTTYTLISVADGTLPTCTTQLNNHVTVTVNQPVDAGVVGSPATLCAGVAQTIQLSGMISGEDPGGIWTETSIVPSTGGAFQAASGNFNTAGQQPGQYQFTYSLQAALPCPSQSNSVSVTIHPTPAADAGTDQQIDCHQDMATLGGPGTSQGAGIQHQWLLNGQNVGDQPQITVAQGGDYTLEVSNSFGCSDSDAVEVVEDADRPFATGVDVDSISCFGLQDGVIRIDSIHSNHQPVTISLNGVAGPGTTVFEDLEPGTYLINLSDSNGCEWVSDTLTVVEPPLFTVGLGDEVVVSLGDSVFLNASSTLPLSDLIDIQWNPLFDSTHTADLVQHFLPFKSSYIHLSLVSKNGCSAESTVLVRVERPLQVFIPNAIRPESAIGNHKMIVYGGPGVAEIETFKVFDRWGEQIHEASHFMPDDETKGWDGTYKGDPAPPGVYVYVVKVRYVDGQVEVFKGDVTVVR